MFLPSTHILTIPTSVPVVAPLCCAPWHPVGFARISKYLSAAWRTGRVPRREGEARVTTGTEARTTGCIYLARGI